MNSKNLPQTWTLEDMAAGIDPREPARVEFQPQRMKSPLRTVKLAREHYAESARAALEKAAEWMEEGLTVRAYPSQSGDEDDFSWVVEAYNETDRGAYVRNPLRRDQDRLDAIAGRLG